ncbi:unnamed protein product, partial [Prunus brigantina]
MTEERRAAEVKRLSESSKRRLMMGLQGQKKKKGQQETVPTPSAGADVDDQSLGDRLRQMSSGSGQAGPAALGRSPSCGAPTEGASSRAAGRRVVTVDLDAEPALKRGRQSEVPRAIFSVEDDEGPTDPVNLACPAKTVQFANHMILDGRTKVAEAGKAIQANATLAKDLQAAERQVKFYEAKFAEMSAALESVQLTANEALEALEAVQVALEESERTKASEIEAAIWGYRRSSEFSNLLDSEKLNLNFIADPPPLPEGITEEMIEQYEGEVIPEPEAEEPATNATEGVAAD